MPRSFFRYGLQFVSYDKFKSIIESSMYGVAQWLVLWSGLFLICINDL